MGYLESRSELIALDNFLSYIKTLKRQHSDSSFNLCPEKECHFDCILMSVHL